MGLGSFLGGVAKGAGEEFTNQENKAFQLKLVNAQIEANMNAKMAEQAQAAHLSSVPAGDADALRKWSGMPTNEKPMNKETASVALGMGKAQFNKDAMMSRLTRPRVLAYDDGNTHIVKSVNPATGEVLWTSSGNSKESVTKMKEATAAYGEYQAVSNEIHQGVESMNLGADFPSNLGRAAKLQLNKLTQDNPKALAYSQTVMAYSTRLEKLLTGTARQALPLVEAMRGELPKETDTLETAHQKMLILDNLFEHAFQSQIRAWGNPINSVEDAQKLAKGSNKYTATDVDAVLKKLKEAEKPAKVQ